MMATLTATFSRKFAQILAALTPRIHRRTFICFALSSGIPPQVVMKWTGHSDYKAMKPYIDIAEKTKANAMALFESEMSK